MLTTSTVIIQWVHFGPLRFRQPLEMGQWFTIHCPLTHLGQNTHWQKDLLNQVILLGTIFLSKLLIICIINYYICRINQYSGGNCLNKTSSFFYSLLSESGHKKLKSTIQRSTETGMAAEMRKMVRQPSRESTDGSINSYSSEGK